MSKAVYHSLILSSLAILISCIEPLSWTGEITPPGTLVVEGRITSENGPHYIYLRSTQSVIADGEGPGVDGALVTITDGENIFPLRDKGSGVYCTDSLVRGVVGRTYELRVEIGSEIYLANAELLPAISLDPLEIRPWVGDPDNQEGIQYFEFSYRSNFGAPRAYLYALDLKIPENVRDFYPENWDVPLWIDRVLSTPDHILRDTSYYLHPGLEPPALLSNGESIYAGITYGTQVTEKFYSISPDHYEFIRAVSAETDWRGLGPFGYIPANVPTNLTNGALGWFSASDVVVIKTKVE